MDVTADLAERLAAAWTEGEEADVTARVPPPVELTLNRLLQLPRRERNAAPLSLSQLGAWDIKDPWASLRLLPAFHPRRIFTPAPQNLEPPSAELRARFPRALRDEFRGGLVSDAAATWRRWFPESRWAQRVSGIGWAFNHKLGDFSDPDAVFHKRVELDNHASCEL